MKSLTRAIITEDFAFTDITASELTDGDAANGETYLDSSKFGAGVITATGGFEPGHTYQVELLNEDLIFDDSHDAFADLKATERYDISEIRYFNFTIEKDGTLHLQLDDGIEYISIDTDVSGGWLSQEDADKLLDYAGLYQVGTGEDGDTTYTPTNDSGTFRYTKENTIQVGDIVSVYTGDKPTERAPDNSTARASQTDNGAVACVKITAINGDVYTYVSAEADEVLFTPDILPVTSRTAAATIPAVVSKCAITGCPLKIYNSAVTAQGYTYAVCALPTLTGVSAAVSANYDSSKSVTYSQNDFKTNYKSYKWFQAN